jgi:hypothetical protein
MTVQELQQKYVTGAISYDEYQKQLEQLRDNVSNVTQHNNSWYYIAGIGAIFLLYMYIRKK